MTNAISQKTGFVLAIYNNSNQDNTFMRKYQLR